MSAHRAEWIVPRPVGAEPRAGVFELGSSAPVTWSGRGAEGPASLFAAYLRVATGFALPVGAAVAPPGGGVHFDCASEPEPDDAGFTPEGYEVRVEPDGVEVRGESPAGLARAVQTLRQLFPDDVFAGSVVRRPWELPCVAIADRPRMRWRGLHLDVARHFFPVEDVCRWIDLLALHRFNVCHLHLVDDQGWRIDVPKHPKLVEIGSVRAETLVGHERDRPRRYDGIPHGGHYSAADLRRIVAFAAARGVAVLPEVEMPGHSQAALAAYPHLGCGVERLAPRCHWGISHHLFNVEEETLDFLRDVLDAVIEVFPWRFVHLGGDEASKLQWSESRRVQERMAELGLRSEEELQSWFIARMGGHLASRGRRLIGWDEILEGGLAPGAAVMSWRDESAGVEAARKGHDVVMAPSHTVYFDHYQAEPVAGEPLAIGGLSTVEKVYAYEPVPAGLEEEHAVRVLGAQGQLWTEYIADRAHLEYMAYPRACALAEALWLPRGSKDARAFARALRVHRGRLAVLGVNARPSP